MYYVRGGAYLAFGRDFVPLMLRAIENMNMPATIPLHREQNPLWLIVGAMAIFFTAAAAVLAAG